MQFRAISNENAHMENIIEHLSYIFANQMLILSLPVSNQRKLSSHCKNERKSIISSVHVICKPRSQHIICMASPLPRSYHNYASASVLWKQGIFFVFLYFCIYVFFVFLYAKYIICMASPMPRSYHNYATASVLKDDHWK